MNNTIILRRGDTILKVPHDRGGYIAGSDVSRYFEHLEEMYPGFEPIGQCNVDWLQDSIELRKLCSGLVVEE